MTAPNLADRFRMSLAEGEEFYFKYKKALPTLFNWEHRVVKRAKRQGTAYTYFGRPRRVRFYFQNGQIGFGKRTCVNTTVQGSASDILKLTMIKLWKNLLGKPEYKDDVRFINTVHDEVNFAVRVSKAKEILPLIQKTMDFELPEWPVKIASEMEVGFTWGDTIGIQMVEKEDGDIDFLPSLDEEYRELDSSLELSI